MLPGREKHEITDYVFEKARESTHNGLNASRKPRETPAARPRSAYRKAR